MSNSDIVLVHGAWHDASCWQSLVPLLEIQGHTVHTPDLPGHGHNKADPASITLKVYSQYISQLIDNIENDLILVGHSMSGMVISQVAESRPEKISRLVYLCGYLPCDGQSLFDVIAANRGNEVPAAIEEAMHLSADKRFYALAPGTIPALFYNRCADNDNVRLPQTQANQPTLPLAGKVNLSLDRFGGVPKTYICCHDDRVIPIRHQRRMLMRQPCDEMIQLDADHSPFLSCPQTLAAVLHSVSLES